MGESQPEYKNNNKLHNAIVEAKREPWIIQTKLGTFLYVGTT